jgi:hypothetical protein
MRSNLWDIMDQDGQEKNRKTSAAAGLEGHATDLSRVDTTGMRRDISRALQGDIKPPAFENMDVNVSQSEHSITKEGEVECPKEAKGMYSTPFGNSSVIVVRSYIFLTVCF